MAVQYNTVSVGSTPTLILASNPGRRMFVIYNNGSNIIYIGPDANVSSSNGIPITQNSSFTQNGSRMWMGAWYGITVSSTSDTRYMDYNE
jgi:hypothetical protein